MTVLRMDNVLIVVDDLSAVIAFFEALGLELEGRMTVEGPWVDHTIGLRDVRSEIAVMRTPDGHGKVELSKFHRPTPIRPATEEPPVNTLGFGRIMFAVDDIDAVVARLGAHGARLVDQVVRFEDQYRLCYMRGPEGIVVALAEAIGPAA